MKSKQISLANAKTLIILGELLRIAEFKVNSGMYQIRFVIKNHEGIQAYHTNALSSKTSYRFMCSLGV